MENNSEDRKIITHDFPIWREKANFIIANRLIELDVPINIRWEQIWARQLKENIFEVCCIPFFSYGLALGDFVNTSQTEGRQYVINKIVEKKGHFTYRIFFLEKDHWTTVVKHTQDLDCLVEKRWEKSMLVGVDAPTTEIAIKLEVYLRELEANGIIEWETGLQ